MSGVSLAWILVMISWLMFSTFSSLTFTPEPLDFSSSQVWKPSTIGWSTLIQTLIVVGPSPLASLSPLPQAVRPVAARASADAAMILRAFMGSPRGV